MPCAYEKDCFVHGPAWRDEFEEALTVLRKRGCVPTRLAKRSGYLVCNCRKKHTNLDDSFASIGYAHLMKTLSDALGLEFPKGGAKKPTESDGPKDKKESSTDTKTGESLNTGQRRLLTLAYHCYMCDTEILEPRQHHREKVEAFRELKRGGYQSKKK